MANRNHHVVQLADAALDKFKHEVATELGLEDDIQTKGWAKEREVLGLPFLAIIYYYN